jgi:hypothetical protein
MKIVNKLPVERPGKGNYTNEHEKSTYRNKKKTYCRIQKNGRDFITR